MNIPSIVSSPTDSVENSKPAIDSRPVIKIGSEYFSEAALFQKLQSHRLLPQLCREILIEQATSSLEITPEEAALGRQVVYQLNQIQEERDRQTWMQQRGMTPELFEQWSQRQIQVEIFKRRRWGAETGSYFLKRKESFDRAIYSLIRHADRAVIQELFFRIQAKEDIIANLAAQYSQGSEQQTNGLVGPMELGRVHPRLAQLLRIAKPGQVNSPIQLENWFVIIQLEKWLPAQYDPATEQRLLDELFQQWLEQQLKEVELQENCP
jgi:parvulin-like peptidyl-prolyl isomerase